MGRGEKGTVLTKNILLCVHTLTPTHHGTTRAYIMALDGSTPSVTFPSTAVPTCLYVAYVCTCTHKYTHMYTRTYIPEVCLSDLPEVVGSAQPLCKHPRALGSKAEVDVRHPVLDVVLGVKGGEVLAGRSASLGPLVSTFGLGRRGTAIYNTHRDTRQYTLLLSLPLQLMYLYAQRSIHT